MGGDNKDSEMEGVGRRACGPVSIPTDEEKEALDRLRAVKARVQEIKASLEGVSDGPEKAALEGELERLRGEWDRWQERREQAARNRMIMLGHEEPDASS